MTTDDENAPEAGRLDAVESHVAHQDGDINDLSDVVVEQWKAIEAMKDQIERLEARLQSMEETIDRPPGEEPPPPHY